MRALSFIVSICVAICVLPGCLVNRDRTADSNPSAVGFNAEASDARAIQLADETMRAMGGRSAWNDTRYLTWNFFGMRSHLWDRHAQRDRIEYETRDGKKHVIVVDLESQSGRAWIDGKPVTDAEMLNRLMDRAWEMWVNDSYWLVMPYKLKDTGVTLTYVGKGETQDGVASDIIELTFEDVGVTPNNKYHVWIAKDSKLVRQFAYFENESDDEPVLVRPWRDWTRHGRIMLSADRGEADLSDIAVLNEVPDTTWSEPHSVEH